MIFLIILFKLNGLCLYAVLYIFCRRLSLTMLNPQKRANFYIFPRKNRNFKMLTCTGLPFLAASSNFLFVLSFPSSFMAAFSGGLVSKLMDGRKKLRFGAGFCLLALSSQSGMAVEKSKCSKIYTMFLFGDSRATWATDTPPCS